MSKKSSTWWTFQNAQMTRLFHSNISYYIGLLRRKFMMEIEFQIVNYLSFFQFQQFSWTHLVLPQPCTWRHQELQSVPAALRLQEPPVRTVWQVLQVSGRPQYSHGLLARGGRRRTSLQPLRKSLQDARKPHQSPETGTVEWPHLDRVKRVSTYVSGWSLT